jgi:thiol-disulfide isomerase/thioredoxin
LAKEKNRMFPALRPVLLAGVAGALAGAVAVYVTSRPTGNNDAAAPVASVSDADIAACAARADGAKAIAATAKGDVAAMLAADPPQSLKALAFNDPDGKPMTLADRSGKTLLLNLWATWCFPCREEMPALDALQAEMGGERFEVIAVNVDTGDDAKPRKFLAETGIDTLGYYRDNTLSLFNDLKARGLALGLPVTLLIDAEGCLLAHMNGPADWAGEDAKRLVAAAGG